MPYITKTRRSYIDYDTEPPQNSGELNYAITMLVDQYLSNKGLCYGSVNEAVGALECAKMELYRRIAAPYEDIKIHENGDVYRCDK